MTVMRRVKADGKASVPKPDTTVSGPKNSSRPGSSVGSQPKVKNSSKKHLRKQKPSKEKSSKSSWWTQQDFELVFTSLIMLSLAGFFAFDVSGRFYSAVCNQERADPARAYPGPISLTIDKPGTYTWSAAIEQPGTYVWSDGVLTTYSTQFATRTVDCCRTVRPS
jgi:hypothetical protein